MFFIHSSPLLDSTLDSATLLLVTSLLLLSLLSICFIFHLRFKSRFLHQLQDFNSLWSARFILVSFITLWALNELLRIPFFRHQYLFSFSSSLSLPEQASLCKVQLVLSLGFFEPAFLVTLLFLVNVSIKKKTPNDTWAMPFVLVTCFPILILHTYFVFLAPLSVDFPSVLIQSSVVFKNDLGNKIVLCSYPLLSTIVFAAFGIGYSLCFLVSCWKVMALVINKGLRLQIYRLAFAVLISLPLQIVCLGLSVLGRPEDPLYGGLALIAFLATFLCAAMGEGILVIRPISDSLSAGGECCRWSPDFRSRHQEEEGGKPLGVGNV